MPPNCRLAPGQPVPLKREELFTKFEESSEAEVAYIKLASDRLTENQVAKTLWREQVHFSLEMNPSFSLVGDQKADLVLAGQ